MSPTVVARPSSQTHHGTLVLDDFSGGINTAVDSRSLQPNELKDAVGFVVDRLGRLRTEPPWFPAPTTGLPTDPYYVLGGTTDYDVWDINGNYAGYYYLVLYVLRAGTWKVELWRSPRQNVNWQGTYTFPSNLGFSAWHFGKLNDKLYAGTHGYGVVEINKTTGQPLEDSAGVPHLIKVRTASGAEVMPLPGGPMLTHQSRLWCQNYRTMRWSEVNNASDPTGGPYGWLDTNNVTLPSEEATGESDTKNGVWTITKWGNQAILLWSPFYLLVLEGYPPMDLQLRPVAPEMPTIGGQASARAYDNGPVLFLSPDNEIWQIDSLGNVPRLVSHKINRKRQSLQEYSVQLHCYEDYLYVPIIMKSPSDLWDRNQISQQLRPEGDIGWVYNWRSGAWTRSAYLNYVREVNGFGFLHFVDLNFGRVFRVFDKGAGQQSVIQYRDLALDAHTPGYIQHVLPAGSTYPDHWIITGDTDCGAPDNYKHLSEIRIKASPLDPSLGPLDFNVYVSYDMGPFQQVSRLDRHDATSSPNWPADGYLHRGRHPWGRRWRYIALKIQYGGSTIPTGQGLVLDRIEIDFYREDPVKT